MELGCLKWENWGRHELLDGQVLRSNEFGGPDSDIIIHKNRAMLNRYFVIFEAGFKPNSIFEIGVKEGGSLVLWYELFKCKVAGIDNDISQLSPEFLKYVRGVPIVVGNMDAFDSDRVESFIGRTFWSTIDLIVDDCQHTIEQIPHNLKMYWEMLSPGGKYIIEDWKALEGKHRVQMLRIMSDHCFEHGADIYIWPEMIEITRLDK